MLNKHKCIHNNLYSDHNHQHTRVKKQLHFHSKSKLSIII